MDNTLSIKLSNLLSKFLVCIKHYILSLMGIAGSWAASQCMILLSNTVLNKITSIFLRLSIKAFWMLLEKVCLFNVP